MLFAATVAVLPSRTMSLFRRTIVGASTFMPTYSSSRWHSKLLSAQAADDDTTTIITPRDPDTLHNFGPASSRDAVIFTCERPGGEPAGKIPESATKEWVEFMREKGIGRVLVLLDDNELECYEDPGLMKIYEKAGFDARRVPMGELGASKRALNAVSESESDGTKIVAHCTHGQGRAGRVAAGWLAAKYDLSPEDATLEALESARKHGVTRLGSPKKLKNWLEAF
jgi:protein-tyrosine phosphatase